MCEKCFELGIPEHLHSKGREIDNVFDSELIYRRYFASGKITDWMKDGSISAAIFPVRNDSCNRSKYCKDPTDVLYNTREGENEEHYIHMGILGFNSSAVEDFSHTIKHNNNDRVFRLKMQHDPRVCMYPHCEIIVLENGERVNSGKPKSVKVLVRDILLNSIEIISYPGEHMTS